MNGTQLKWVLWFFYAPVYGFFLRVALPPGYPLLGIRTHQNWGSFAYQFNLLPFRLDWLSSLVRQQTRQLHTPGKCFGAAKRLSVSLTDVPSEVQGLSLRYPYQTCTEMPYLLRTHTDPRKLTTKHKRTTGRTGHKEDALVDGPTRGRKHQAPGPNAFSF